MIDSDEKAKRLQPERYTCQTIFKEYYIDKYGLDFALVVYCNCKRYDMASHFAAIRVLGNRRIHVKEMHYFIKFIQADHNK